MAFMPRTYWRHDPPRAEYRVQGELFPHHNGETPVSYSFGAKGASKTEAILDAEAKFADVVRQQPAHAIDQEAALKNLREQMALLADPAPDEDVVVSMYGSICVVGETASRVTSANASCNVGVSRRTTIG